MTVCQQLSCYVTCSRVLQIVQFSLSLNEFLLQLAEVICEETALRQENRKMSVIIAEAQTVTHIIINILIITLGRVSLTKYVKSLHFQEGEEGF